MNPFLFLMIAFIAVPIAEIYVLIEVGGQVGVLNTIALVILTAVIGASLVRSQGLATLARIQSGLQAGEAPGQVLVEGALILFAGVLLLTPGFMTDAVGFICLLPPTRAWLASRIASRAVTHAMGGGVWQGGFGTPRGQSSGSVIDGEFTKEPPRGERLDRPEK